MAPRPTIRDVAVKAGFSISTVSMVLNNKEVSIPAETREKVWKAASSLGYRPNRLALSLLTKRTMMLGLVIPDNGSLFFASLSKAIESEARKAGYSLIYGNSDNRTERDMAYMEMFLDYQVDGFILCLSPFADEEQEEAMRQRLESISAPVVLVDRRARGSARHMVQMNHRAGGYLVADHLLGLGHRRIGVFCSPGVMSSRQEKLEGYRAAYLDRGLDPDEGLFPIYVDTEDTLELEHFRWIMDNRLTAVQTICDSMAVELYRLARKEGVSIPADLSVVGHDDLSFSDLLTPPLTSIRQPTAEIGRATVHTLVALIADTDRHPQKKDIQMFEPQLIVRESTAAPKMLKTEESDHGRKRDT